MGGASTKRVEALEAQATTLEQKTREQDVELKRQGALLSDIQLRQAAQGKEMMSDYTLKSESTDMLDKLRVVELHKARTEPLLEALQEKATAVDNLFGLEARSMSKPRTKPVDDLVTFQDLEAQIPGGPDRLRQLEAEVERLMRGLHVQDERVLSQRVQLQELTAEVNSAKEELKSQQAALQTADEIRMRDTERLEEGRRKLTQKLESTVVQGQEHKAALEAENHQLLAEFELAKQLNEQTLNDLETTKECLSRELSDTRASAMEKIQNLEARNRQIEWNRKSTAEALGMLREAESSQRALELRRMLPSQETAQRQSLLEPEIDL